MDHHTCHAYYAAFAPNIKEKKSGILTIDSEGDGLNQTFWIFDKSKNKLIKINESSECDLARIYRFITLILKMKPNEHEFKVMGLAPYAKDQYSAKVYNEVFKNILQVKNCKIVHKDRPKNLFEFLYLKTKKYRFDNIAGAVQLMVEKISSEFLKQIIKKYKLHSFSISGGVSMNIKMNKCLSSLSEVKKIYVPPTGTDESLSIGACYYINCKKNNNKFLKNIYLGQELSENDINLNKIIKLLKNKKNYLVRSNINHKHIAELLSAGEIIAVARGREEFGARALGNRSILANPTFSKNKSILDMSVKQRDSYRPYAPVVLEEFKDRYFVIKHNSPVMMSGGKVISEKLPAITHIDGSARIQTLKKSDNEELYKLILNFMEFSGHPVLLNTSFNQPGEPIVESPYDALNSFKNSSMDYLCLGNYLVSRLEN